MQAKRTERSRPKGSSTALRWAPGARWWRARTLWLPLALVCIGGTAAAKVEEDVEARVGARDSAPSLPFRPGEELVYEIRALGMKAGQARIQVGTWAERDGVRSWPVVVQARTDSVFDSIYPVRDRFITWWDPETGRVLGADFWADERGKRHRSRSRLDHDAGRAEVVRYKEWNGERSTREYDIPSGSYDIAGAILALRQRPLAPGSVERVPVFTGSKVFDLVCEVEGIETIQVGAGSYRALATRIKLGFDGNFKAKRDVRVWFTDDERKIPLRMEADFVIGSVVADLTRARGI